MLAEAARGLDLSTSEADSGTICLECLLDVSSSEVSSAHGMLFCASE